VNSRRNRFVGTVAASGIKRAAREALNKAIRGLFSAGRQKRKKK
jgi:hypothetical protein